MLSECEEKCWKRVGKMSIDDFIYAIFILVMQSMTVFGGQSK
jgi:hypothetical protein